MPVRSGSIQICRKCVAWSPCVVELAVLHASAGTHALHVAGRDALHVAHAVLVRQLAVQHVADDLHVAVAMGAEAGARRDAVFVDDPQVAPAHVGRVVVVGEREAVPAVSQPWSAWPRWLALCRMVSMVGSPFGVGCDSW
jgi:hypothetical protein